jgi:hypothetical protein
MFLERRTLLKEVVVPFAALDEGVDCGDGVPESWGRNVLP